MLLRDKLLARMADMGSSPDYVQLAAEVLGIRNTPPGLARRLVDQALVVEDRREVWIRTGERICADAPALPGVYLLRDANGHALYVGKANNIRRRLRTHFADRRWRSLKPQFARATDAEWLTVGSEIEALVREAVWIRGFAPVANVQVSLPVFESRALPPSLLRDAIVVLPSADDASVELLAVRAAGPVMLVRASRDGTGLTARVTAIMRFFAQPVEEASAQASDDPRAQISGLANTTGADRLGLLAPLVFTWLAGRGAAATRLDPHDTGSARELERRVRVLLEDEQLFTERIVVSRSAFRSIRGRT